MAGRYPGQVGNSDNPLSIQNPTIDQRVEILCELGCRVVQEIIEALQTGLTRQEFADFDTAQRALLLRELQAIMSVYNNRCRL